MRGQEQVITLLNDVLTAELTAINQYFIHARMCENWGYERLWKKVREESIGEMRHADKLIARILYLEGVPNVQRLGRVNVGETVPEQLRLDLEVEHAAVTLLNNGIELCRSLGDNGSRDLLEEILRGEEQHIDWIESQLTLIQQMGEAHYLAQQVHDEGVMDDAAPVERAGTRHQARCESRRLAALPGAALRRDRAFRRGVPVADHESGEADTHEIGRSPASHPGADRAPGSEPADAAGQRRARRSGEGSWPHSSRHRLVAWLLIAAMVLWEGSAERGRRRPEEIEQKLKALEEQVGSLKQASSRKPRRRRRRPLRPPAAAPVGPPRRRPPRPPPRARVADGGAAVHPAALKPAWLTDFKIGGYGSTRFEASDLPQVATASRFRRFVLSGDATIANRIRSVFELEFERLDRDRGGAEDDGGGRLPGLLAVDRGQQQLGDLARAGLGRALTWRTGSSSGWVTSSSPSAASTSTTTTIKWDLPRRSLVDRGVSVLPVNRRLVRGRARLQRRHQDRQLGDLQLSGLRHERRGARLDARDGGPRQRRVRDGGGDPAAARHRQPRRQARKGLRRPGGLESLPGHGLRDLRLLRPLHAGLSALREALVGQRRRQDDLRAVRDRGRVRPHTVRRHHERGEGVRPVRALTTRSRRGRRRSSRPSSSSWRAWRASSRATGSTCGTGSSPTSCAIPSWPGSSRTRSSS